MLYIIIVLAIILADQLFKKWIVTNIPLYSEIALIPSIVHLTYLQNTGAAFSIFADSRIFLIILTGLLSVLLTVFIIKGKLSRWEKVCLSAVLGGAIGNLIDRIFLGYVVDMFEIEFMNFAIFNVADCFIVVGGIMFCVLYFIRSSKEEKSKQ